MAAPDLARDAGRTAVGVLGGASYVFRGIGFGFRRPGPMALGLVPAVIVGAVWLALLILLATQLGALTDAATPFADDWDPTWRELLRAAIGTVAFIAVALFAGLTFTVTTLAVGDPFYERIRRAVDAETGAPVPETGLTAGQQVLEFLRVVGLGLLVALVTALVGFIPAVGGVLASVVGVILAGALLGRELTGRALAARGLGPIERRASHRGHRGALLGFGIAVQLCFLVPLGAVLIMPAAVAGGTLLVHRMLGDEARSPAPPADPEAPAQT